ncbi:MAG: chorismate-binding protein [Planctomycetota bacterium]
MSIARTSPDTGPFGPPLCEAEAQRTEVAARGFDPAALVAALSRRDRGAAGAALLESAGLGGHRAHRTVAVLRAWCRVELREGRAQLTPLVPEASPLVEQLLGRLREPSLETRRPGTGLEDRERLRAPSILDALRTCAGAVTDRRAGAALPPGLFGALGYELVDHFEDLPPRRPEPFDDPDASFVLAGDIAVFDHDAGRLQVVTRGLPWEDARALRTRHRENVDLAQQHAGVPPSDAAVDANRPPPPSAAVADVDDAAFVDQVRAFRAAIGAGEIFQGVLSRGLTMRSDASPIDVYRALRQRNPSPYMFFFDLGDGELLGASPETFLRVEQGTVEIRPIAGTAPRGFGADGAIDHDLDARLALRLQLDRKELAEHSMLLDLARNDIARVARPGTTRVVEQLAVEKYSHVQHLVSRVRGVLAPELDALHAYRAAANMGTLSGAPKVRAMELIRAAEPHGRGFYGGAAGYLLSDGRFDSCIVIRALRHRTGIYHTRAGAGVVWHSDPARELAETEHKSLACRVAIAVAAAQAGPTTAGRCA